MCIRDRKISGRARNISVFSYAELSFHHIDMDNRNVQMSLYAAGGSYADGIIEQDLFYEENGFQYFADVYKRQGLRTPCARRRKGSGLRRAPAARFCPCLLYTSRCV